MRKSAGFTLLEVVVALAVVGLALGAIFGLLAGSKRLAFSAMNNIEQSLYLRSALSIAQAEEKPDYPKLPPAYAEKVRMETGAALEQPERQTIKIAYVLEPYRYTEKDGKADLARSLRWKKLEAVQ